MQVLFVGSEKVLVVFVEFRLIMVCLGRNYIGANAKAKAKISLIFGTPQYKHTTRKSMYPFQAISLSRSLSLQY